ncbi:hypothetical protein VSAK1_26445 [Vibrio mediterranei AK1]|uniref:hypothetical protein n=1 Tax=Vibrio mediterranei TaxID=689 RepID=UPI00015425E1|nr:hypothetical protein [Vibrio mediterranei]EDL52167.1 hypothetical protein VSAK1_26445 [Vibrio mediterranei AK1]
MSRLGNRGASTSISQKKQGKDKSDRITTVRKSVTTSYKVPPLTLRMSLTDKKQITDWVADLQSGTERKLSSAKLFRALAQHRDGLSEREREDFDALLIQLMERMN